MRRRKKMKRKFQERGKELERYFINKYFYGIPALAEKKNNLIFVLLTIVGPSFSIYALPVLRNSFPYLQDKSRMFLIVFSIGMVFGLLARGFLKTLSECWKDVLSNFMKQKPELPSCPRIRIIHNFLKEKTNLIISTYLFTLCFVFSGAIDINYSSLASTPFSSSKNSIVPLFGFIFFGFGWGFANLWMILRIECTLSGVN